MVFKGRPVTDYDPFKHLWAYDPVIKRRTVHVIKGKMAVSLVTGHRFRLTEREIKQLKEEEGKQFKEEGGHKDENKN